MLSTTFYSLGSIVTVAIRFTDDSSNSYRPAVIVSCDNYHKGRLDTIIIPITSQHVDGELFGDSLIVEWQKAGLVKPSKAKGVIQTVDRRTIKKKLGELTPSDLMRVQSNLKSILGV